MFVLARPALEAAGIDKKRKSNHKERSHSTDRKRPVFYKI